ncbi:VanZ family protein [Sulfuricella denitrificans]|uniref:VanZ family protein n=1 Tax=Sulfuricella denitrificans TaxID=649841 RepID=UPI0002E79F02|nr:VanZ family protein [Sulfuricella denitrificans]
MNPTKITHYWRAAGWFGVGLIIYLSLTPSPPQINIDNGDKLGHFAAYGLVTLWFAQLYTGLRQRIGLVIGMVGLGIAMEYAQGTTDYRSFEVADMVADAIGACLGWIAAPPRLPSLLSWAKKHLSKC